LLDVTIPWCRARPQYAGSGTKMRSHYHCGALCWRIGNNYPTNIRGGLSTASSAASIDSSGEGNDELCNCDDKEDRMDPKTYILLTTTYIVVSVTNLVLTSMVIIIIIVGVVCVPVASA
jgi:hypothetical protein